MNSLTKETKILIVGLGVIGGSYARALSRNGYRVRCITKEQKDIDKAKNCLTQSGYNEIITYSFVPEKDFETYGLDGEEYKRYKWADFDASKVSAYTGNEQMKIKLNLAIGSVGGTPDASTNEMKMYVDWVRVYAPLNS